MNVKPFLEVANDEISVVWRWARVSTIEQINGGNNLVLSVSACPNAGGSYATNGRLARIMLIP